MDIKNQNGRFKITQISSPANHVRKRGAGGANNMNDMMLGI